MFVFKQKTSYELRISDWSSDVCSSDLRSDPALHVVAAGPRFLKCYDCVCHSGTMKCVAAGPRFLKCYDSSTTDIASSVVAAGPRFLKCYDSRRGGDVEQGVAAGPRFLKCYDLIVRDRKSTRMNSSQ